MDYIKHKLEEGELEGVKIEEGLTFCYRFFVDDVGIFILATENNFNKLKEILLLYKVVSGAKLNLWKSVIIPLVMSTTPQWIHDTGVQWVNQEKFKNIWEPPLGKNSKALTYTTFA